jgi:hypothetical protein
MHWEGLAESVTTVNGNMHRLWSGATDNRTYNRDVVAALENVKLYTSDLRDGPPNFPFSGTLIAQMTLNKQTPNRQVHVDATLTITFYPDHYHAHLVRGNNYWDWDHFYGP